MELSDLVGLHVFSGIEISTTNFDGRCCYFDDLVNCIKFTLDGITYMAIENPDNGHRSYMGELFQTDETCRIKIPNVKVVCHIEDHFDPLDGEESDILVFVDAANGNIILEIGTAFRDMYYPYSVMNYYPENMACNAVSPDAK